MVFIVTPCLPCVKKPILDFIYNCPTRLAGILLKVGLVEFSNQPLKTG